MKTKNVNYYEIELQKRKDFELDNINNLDKWYLCIKATFYPTFEDVAEFLKEDMKKAGYDMVTNITEMSLEEAEEQYILKKNTPILSKMNI